MRPREPIYSAEPEISPAQTDLPEHLRFYQLCGIIAAVISALVSVLLYLLDVEDFDSPPLLVAFIIAGPVTLLLLLGMVKFPRVCAWLLLGSFSGGILYLYSQGVLFNLVITVLFTCFYLFGAVAASGSRRLLSGKPLWLAGKRYREVLTLLLLAVLLSLCSSGYLLRWAQAKKDNPLQWVEYRRTMVERYIDNRPDAGLSSKEIELKKVRLENKTLVFVYRIAGDVMMDESHLSVLARKAFSPHCAERGVKEFNMKVMLVYHQGQAESVFVFDKGDCPVFATQMLPPTG
ncbi:hypothetical protein C8D90_11388 [Enterobacillus tribolii]|uniref:Uncharacterized protein n=1 Tax=Enterobacillus tribolii TaxID=1487935 RepID=A0A370Q8G6_9GAMM|nr:hypothetical protein C8D90_11388 [Enterobacillus tribolii]